MMGYTELDDQDYQTKLMEEICDLLKQLITEVNK